MKLTFYFNVINNGVRSGCSNCHTGADRSQRFKVTCYWSMCRYIAYKNGVTVGVVPYSWDGLRACY